MRIHTDVLTYADMRQAANIARVDMELTQHGSRSRHHAFNVNLTGESNRRPNRSHNSDDYAATWDQWGVFLSVLFGFDPGMKPQYYADVEEFDTRTDNRFNPQGHDRRNFPAFAGPMAYWPADAHGDHSFKYQGIPYQQECTKCTARMTWGPR